MLLSGGMYMRYYKSKTQRSHRLVAVQHHHFGLSLSNALEAQHVARINLGDKGSIALSEYRILSAVEPDLGGAVLAHRDVDVDVAVASLLGRASTHGPLEALAHADDARTHDEVGMDWDCTWESRFGSRLLSSVGTRASLERGEDVYKAGALRLLVERACVVAGDQTAGPGESPDLEEVNFLVGFVALGVRNAYL